ncbi:hypothetical protein E7Z59_08640 [Robertkochia marina]|uniref:CHRD domain-containing protein n=2 Tax=Robertkochia marina TaxID=1227945 RepID=A0A4S3M0Z2_9FLAO|nr:hypothetical protein E7Z59_08640 [Robertkochia marina]TRZ43466.1 hypothetical protein D3A96_10785 [Robertkochia marina]
MKTCRRTFYVSTLLIAFLLPGCSDDDDNNGTDPGGEDPITEVTSKTYNLGEVDESGISGTARFAEMSDGSVTIDLDINNTPSDGQHPAHIHFNTAAEGGDIALTLGTVDGNTGESTVNVTQLDDGTAITYAELLEYNGYINVHLSSDELQTIVAQGDIGGNELTGESTSYALAAVAESGVSGDIVFEERVNGTSLATISLTGTPEGGEHPAHIHENDAATGGGILVSFNPVNGDTGESKTQVGEFDSGDPLTYIDILALNAYVNVHLSAEALETIVAQGDIGINAGNE